MVTCLLKSTKIDCPLHVEKPIDCVFLIPDLLLQDLEGIQILDPDLLKIEGFLKRGGQAQIFRGFYANLGKVCVKTFVDFQEFQTKENGINFCPEVTSANPEVTSADPELTATTFQQFATPFFLAIQSFRREV